MTVRPVPRCRCRAGCRAGLVANGDSAQPAPVRLRTWLQAAVFGLLCVVAQAAGVPRWSRTMATASRWVNPEPVENA